MARTKARGVLDFIFGRQDKGTTMRGAAAELEIPIYDLQRIFCRLIKAGEIFRGKGGLYYSTTWVLYSNPKPIIEKLRGELEEDIFNGRKPPSDFGVFMEEYHASRGLGLDPEGALRLAEKRYLAERARR